MSATLVTTRPALVLSPRGPVSEAVLQRLTGASSGVPEHRVLASRAATQAADLARDDDVQAALFFLYASAYGSIEQFSPDLEWDGELLEIRQILEREFERELRGLVALPELPAPNAVAVARSLFAMARSDTGPSLSRYCAQRATAGQARELLIQQSIYTLREADPHSWAIPRLTGRPKAALVEIQSDEYGGGRPERVHAHLFATAMQAAGLDDRYAAYLDRVPAITLAAHNLMSLFGLNRRLIGALVGHLAAFEMTSSEPSRRYAQGFRRLGFGTNVTDYFDEHIEADAVHEQIAGQDLAGALVEDHPALLPDVLFGAAAYLAIDAEVTTHLLDAWTRGASALRKEERQ